MKVVLIGSVKFSESCMKLLLKERGLGISLAGVVSKEKSAINADFISLLPLAQESGLPVFEYRGAKSDQELVGWMKGIAPDLVLVLGWSHLLPPEIFSVPPKGTVGFHPAKLPRNRGRHPLIWSLVLGLEETASSFFLINELPDAGPILSQKIVPISYEDDAASLYDRVIETALGQLKEFLPKYASGALVLAPQDESAATSWRKRGAKDGEIDWRMSSRSVYNLVRALTRPYAGAHLLVDGKEMKVWKVKEISAAETDREPGYVMSSNGREFAVKCGEGAVLVMESDLETAPAKGAYL